MGGQGPSDPVSQTIMPRRSKRLANKRKKEKDKTPTDDDGICQMFFWVIFGGLAAAVAVVFIPMDRKKKEWALRAILDTLSSEIGTALGVAIVYIPLSYLGVWQKIVPEKENGERVGFWEMYATQPARIR